MIIIGRLPQLLYPSYLNILIHDHTKKWIINHLKHSSMNSTISWVWRTVPKNKISKRNLDRVEIIESLSSPPLPSPLLPFLKNRIFFKFCKKKKKKYKILKRKSLIIEKGNEFHSWTYWLQFCGGNRKTRDSVPTKITSFLDFLECHSTSNVISSFSCFCHFSARIPLRPLFFYPPLPSKPHLPSLFSPFLNIFFLFKNTLKTLYFISFQNGWSFHMTPPPHLTSPLLSHQTPCLVPLFKCSFQIKPNIMAYNYIRP